MQKPLPPKAMPSIEQLHIESARFRRGIYAYNTLYGYNHDWVMFQRWCDEMQRLHLPAEPETVSLYLTALLTQGRKVTTAYRRTSAIAHHHRQNGHKSPVTSEVRELLRGARRVRRERPNQERALSVQEIRKLCRLFTKDGTDIGIRNRALLVVGFLSALRRSTLVELTLDDVEFCPDGAVLYIGHEKQDQTGRGRYVGLPWGNRPYTCPVRCLRAWLKLRGSQPGPIFTRLDTAHPGEPMSGDAVCHMLKDAVVRIGLDPSQYGAHSLRAGFITAAGEAGVSDLLIAAQTGHRSMHVLRKYFRRTNLFKANAATKIGL
jgi:site-specific recombinase XerD